MNRYDMTVKDFGIHVPSWCIEEDLYESGEWYNVQEVNQHLQKFITNAKHVLRYGTAQEAKEYMIRTIMDMEKEFDLGETE